MRIIKHNSIMKNILLALFISVFALPLMAQDIREVDKTISLGSQPAFVINHPNATVKMAEKAWEAHIKKNGKVKKNRKSKEFESMGVYINMISSSNLDVYFIAEKGADMATSYIFFDNGEAFITSANDQEAADGIYEFLTPFVYDVEKLVVQEELENEEKSLKALGRDLEKLHKQNASYHADIEKYKEKIRQAETNIEQNLQAQDVKGGEIEAQEVVIEDVKKKLNSIGKK